MPEINPFCVPEAPATVHRTGPCCGWVVYHILTFKSSISGRHKHTARESLWEGAVLCMLTHYNVPLIWGCNGETEENQATGAPSFSYASSCSVSSSPLEPRARAWFPSSPSPSPFQWLSGRLGFGRCRLLLCFQRHSRWRKVLNGLHASFWRGQEWVLRGTEHFSLPPLVVPGYG